MSGWQRHRGKFGRQEREEERNWVGEQEEGSRKFLRHFPDPLSFSKYWNMTILLLLFFFLMPLLPHSLVSLLSFCARLCHSQEWWLDFKWSGSWWVCSSVLLQWMRTPSCYACDRDVFIPHVFQQVTFGLVFKVQSCHLIRVCVFQLLCHFDLGETKRHIKQLICLSFSFFFMGMPACSFPPGSHSP